MGLEAILDSVERVIDTKRNRIARRLLDNGFTQEQGENGDEIYARGREHVIFSKDVTYVSGGIPLVMDYKYAADKFFPMTFPCSNIVEHYSSRASRRLRNLINEALQI